MTRRTDSAKWGGTAAGFVVPRRRVLRGGLASFAAVMMSRTLPGCGDPPMSPDAARTDGGSGPVDAFVGPDAGPVVFPARDIPPAPALRSLIESIGPLGEPDANGIRLPAGFTSRLLARANEPVAPTSHQWHLMPDGGATYATEDGGWIYVSNSEMPISGGVGAIRFEPSGEIRSAYRILDRTNVNCAGGKTPWHTWLSCEEVARGIVYECDPWGETASVGRPALGVFKHEAAAIDPVNAHVFLTEDQPDGRFYRFVPDVVTSAGHPDLTSGRLEVAMMAGDGTVTWMELPDPQYLGETPTREQIPTSTVFRGGEGIWYHAGVIYFSTKGDHHVRAYDTATSRISVIYDGSDPGLHGVDNLTVSCCGDVLVAEDGGAMQVVAILPSGELKPLLQVVGADSSEITGPAFDPSGTRLYFSSQRGGSGGTAGVTYEITGPFHEPA